MMVDKAKHHHLQLKPHFKTHQSVQIGKWFKEAGVSAITVSSVGMAEYFASAGWRDITIAFPLNPLMADRLNALASRVNLTLLVDNETAIGEVAASLTNPVNIYIEIDTGAGRTGIGKDDPATLKTVANEIAHHPQLNLKGLYSHAGHSYAARSREEVKHIFTEAKQVILDAKRVLETAGFKTLEICMGDTPTCSVVADFSGVDAISPGNFVFYDLMQVQIGACSLEQIAVAMACPVVSKNRDNLTVCIHGGAVHFSKEYIEEGAGKLFGLVARSNGHAWGEPMLGCYLTKLSQEHGIVQLTLDIFDNTDIGDILLILPVHSCLTAEAMGSYIDASGNRITHYAQKNRDLPGL